MAEMRGCQRITCRSKCVLIINGDKHDAILENISIMGALVTTAGALSGTISPDDTCSLFICQNIALYPCEYISRVAHISSPAIGLEFMGMGSAPR